MAGRDRLVAPIKIGTPAPLSVDDLSGLAGGGRTTTSVQRMRASHHKIARLIAHGLTHKEVAALTGYTRERVNQLVGSPAMAELIAVYMSKLEERENEQFDAVAELMAQNLLSAQRHIADAFAEADDNDQLLPVRTALAVAADSADRLGYAKRTNVKVEHDIGAALERAIARSGKGPILDSVAAQPSRPKLISSLASSPNSSGAEPQRPLILRRA